jgi:Tfp pilus assembly protein PilO
MMNIRSITRNTSFSTVALLAIVGAVFFFGILPLHGRIADQRIGIEKLHAQEENATRKIARLPEFREQVELIDKEDYPLVTVLSEAKIVDFIKSIEDIALQTGSTVAISQSATQKKKAPAVAPAVAPLPIEKDSGTPAPVASATKKKVSIEDGLPSNTDLRLSIAVTGEYPKVIQFLHKIETLPYALDVLSLEIRGNGEGSSRSNGSASPFASATAVFSDNAAVSGDGVPTGAAAVQEVVATFEVAAYYQGK